MRVLTNRVESGRSVLIALAMLLISFAVPCVADAGATADLLPQPMDLLSPSYRPAAAPCSLYNNNKTAIAYLSTIEPGDRFASYLNPVNCGGTEDFPMAIYWISLPLYHFEGVHWPVGATVQIYEKAGLDSCSGPGELLYSQSCLLDSASFCAPHVGVVTLPDPVCVTGPFYVVVEFNGSTPQPYPSVLFDTQIPADPCLNWVYRGGWVPWNVFWASPGAGNFMIWVDGYSNSDVCGADEPEIQSIASLYANWPTLVGTRVTTIGYCTDSADAKLVSDYADYLKNEPMPVHSSLGLVGPSPDSSNWSDLCEVTGYLMAERNGTPYYVDDSVRLTLYPSKWTRILQSPAFPGAEWDTVFPDAHDPDTNWGYFGLMVGGGVDESNNHARYWNDLVKLYEREFYFAQAPAENLFVLYGDGISRDTGKIPQARVDSLTVGELQAAFGRLSHGVATRIRAGQLNDVHMYIGGQGSNQGILTLGGQPFTAAQLRAGVQAVIDSGCRQIHMDFAGAYAGALAESLKTVNDRGAAFLKVGSAAGSDLSYSSSILSPYFDANIDSLLVGGWYGGTQTDAAFAYVVFMDSLAQSWSRSLDSTRIWLSAHPPGTVSDSVRAKIVADSLSITSSRAELGTILASTTGRPRLWWSLHHTEFNRWMAVCAPPGGQVVLTFSGDTLYSGDVTVYKDTVHGTGWNPRKAAVWKLNIPGSKGYQSGNERRVINADNSATTVYWLVNDSRHFDMVADILTDQPNGESGSNGDQGAGFSLGHSDNSSSEFGMGPYWGHHNVYNPELPGVFMDTFPHDLPSAEIYVYYDIPSQNQFWTDMEFWVSISSVTTPGPLNMTVSGADVENFAIPITGPGVYTFPVGSISGIGQHLVGFWPTSGWMEFDSWALRSRISDPSTCCIGMTGNVDEAGIVDLSDLSMLVIYLTGGMPSLPCTEEANINGLGIVDLSDLSLLISYLTGGGAVLPSCP